MNYLLYGADTYRSRAKLRDIITEHRPKAGGGLTFHRFDAAEDDLAGFAAAAAGGALFAAKQLIVLERPFTASRQFEIVQPVLAETHRRPDALIAVWDEMPDAEGKKMLKKTEKYFDKRQEFLPLAGASLQRWIRDEAARRGVALSAADAAALCALGPDLWRVTHEMEKIAVGGGAVRAAAGGGAPSVFDLGDAFFVSPPRARHILLSLLAAGEDEMRLFAYLAGHARALLMVKASLERGGPVPAAAMLHPFVVRKASAIVRALSVADLARTLRRFLDEDRKIKTGGSTARESLLRLLNA